MEAAPSKLENSTLAKINGKSQRRQGPAARDLVIEYFRAHPGIDIATQTLKEHVAVKRPDLGKNVIHTIVHGLKEKGLILQTRPRWYRVTSNIVLPDTSLTHQKELPETMTAAAGVASPAVSSVTPSSAIQVDAAKPSLPTSALAAAPVTDLTARTGDSFIDGYLEELEAAASDALKAFDRIDAIAKRTHRTLVQFAALKCSLGMLGDSSPPGMNSPDPAANGTGSPNGVAFTHK